MIINNRQKLFKFTPIAILYPLFLSLSFADLACLNNMMILIFEIKVKWINQAFSPETPETFTIYQ